MGYSGAMVAAGAEVLDFEQFGSYQGDFLAKVKYQGEVGWAHGWYGSCSGCDAFEAEFGYNCREECEEHRYLDPVEDCVDCVAAKTVYDEKLKSFGLRYLTDLLSYAEVVAIAEKHSDWDVEADEMVKWVKERK